PSGARRPPTAVGMLSSRRPRIGFVRIAAFIGSGRSEPSKRNNLRFASPLARWGGATGRPPSWAGRLALAAARHLALQISLVGVPAAIAPALDRHPDWRELQVRVVEAPDVIEMAESTAAARR